MKRIQPGLYTFSGLGAGRVYLIRDSDGLTLVDAGLEASTDKIIEQLEGVGEEPANIKRILITHAHPDHVGGLHRLKEVSGAQVIASEIERPVIEGEVPIPRPSKDSLSGLARFISIPETTLPGIRVDRIVGEGDRIGEAMGGLEVLFTPGHAPGHLAFWQPGLRVLFCGDVMMYFLGRLRLPISIATVDMYQNRLSIGQLAQLDAETVLFGHGEPLTENAAETVRAFAEKVSPDW